MIKYFADKMETRGKEYSMVDREDEELLINPNNKNKKDSIAYKEGENAYEKW